MGKKKQMSLPSSGGAGIVSYYNDVKGKVELDPKYLLIFITVFASAILVMKVLY